MSQDFDIFIFDDLHPEDSGMLQAMISRSPASVLTHMEKIKKTGSGKFMETFYTGYGHQSIGDCGNTAIFIEQVSSLAAKATQGHDLYSGQEASTRYLDFSKQKLYDPYNHPESLAILKRWIDIYTEFKELVTLGIIDEYPYNKNNEKGETVWHKTINAKAFDICRSLLPIGVTTYLSWTTNLRQARDHLRFLATNPLPEIQELAKSIVKQLKEKYSNSFDGYEALLEADHEYQVSDIKVSHKEKMAYLLENAQEDHYLSFDTFDKRIKPIKELSEFYNEKLVIDLNLFEEPSVINSIEEKALSTRPRGALLPKRFKQYGVFNNYCLLDFGSWRDIQRHRNGYCPHPLITNEFGFYNLYLQEFKKFLKEEDYNRLHEKINLQFNVIHNLKYMGIDTNDYQNQYLYPMGITVPCQMTYDMGQMVYVSELRSQKTVHFTLRPIAQQMGNYLEKHFPNIKLYVDYDNDNFTLKRGTQDIVEKRNV